MRDTNSFTAGIVGAEMVNGRLDAGPFEMELPATILGVEVVLTLHSTTIRIEAQEDGTFTGHIGAGTDIDYIIAIAQKENVDETLASLLESLLTVTADLGEACDEISITIEFVAEPAYFID